MGQQLHKLEFKTRPVKLSLQAAISAVMSPVGFAHCELCCW